MLFRSDQKIEKYGQSMMQGGQRIIASVFLAKKYAYFFLFFVDAYNLCGA
jgi:hypothetical protein